MKNIETKEDFDSELGKGGERLILFYSAWCPFCASFLPVFRAAAAANPAIFAEVSIDDLPMLEDAYDIEVVPTVMFFKDKTLKSRLDGVLGRGLNEDRLNSFLKTSVFLPGTGQK